MPLPILALAGLAAKAIPSIAGWLGGDDAEKTAEKVVSVARQVTGLDDDEKAVSALASNPEYAIEAERMMHEWRVAKLTEETKRLQTVNETMRAEAKSEDPWTRRWRPFNGFMFGVTLFSTYFVLPLCGKEVPAIEEWVWMAWAAVLGVTSWHRGIMQNTKAKQG